MWGRFCNTLQGNPIWKFLLALPGMTGCSFSNLIICTDLSFQRCRKAFQAAPCQPERIKHLLLTALPESQSSPSRNEAAAWAEPLTSFFQSHFSLNQPCQSLALPGRNLSLPISPPPPSKGSFLLVFPVMFINQEEEVDESSWLLGRRKIKSRRATTPENDKSNPTGTLLTSWQRVFQTQGFLQGFQILGLTQSLVIKWNSSNWEFFVSCLTAWLDAESVQHQLWRAKLGHLFPCVRNLCPKYSFLQIPRRFQDIWGKLIIF